MKRIQVKVLKLGDFEPFFGYDNNQIKNIKLQSMKDAWKIKNKL